MSLENTARIPTDQLHYRFDERWVPWASTNELTPCAEIIGQERALRAIRLGLEMKGMGYNIFVTGLSGTGRMTTIKALLENIDHSGKLPDDLCYIHNFKHPDLPLMLRLPPGGGKKLKKEMGALIEHLKTMVPNIMETDSFKKKLDDLREGFRSKEKEIVHTFEQKVNSHNFVLVQIQDGPIQRPDLLWLLSGTPTPLAQIETMVDQGKFARDEFDRIAGLYKELVKEMGEISKRLKALQKELEHNQVQLVKETIRPQVEEQIGEIRRHFSGEKIGAYLDEVREDILERLDIFREKEEEKGGMLSLFAAPKEMADPFLPFEVNVLVDNSDLRAIPVIIETAPNYRNLFGTIEKHLDRSGVARTDFTRVKAGSFLRANGGYLVMNARDTLMEPEVWKTLNRALKYNEVSIQTYDPFYMFASAYLKPEPITVNVKVVLIGEKEIYRLLYMLDEDFKKIFKVLADFDSVMNNTESNVHCLAGLMSKICDEESLNPFDRDGILAVLEQAVRLAGRKNKLTSRFSDVADIMREADFWARKEDAPFVSRPHVEKAVREREMRNSLLEEKLQEMIEEGLILIDAKGATVGQVNGLSVYSTGYYSFGKPTRITAEVAVGSDGVLNIEREAGLSGNTHDKGVLILTNLIRSRYTTDKPLSMNASLCFEQSYGGVDGDSASSTEVYALMSALAGLPLRQDLAVTGSVNQKGQIQPIGGVNEKIEGFFDVCAARGLTGKQGVIIPIQNIGDLMLREEVVSAARQGEFHIYAISTVDEGIELLSGVPAGIPVAKGKWTPDSVNDRVNIRLQQFADTLKEYKVE